MNESDWNILHELEELTYTETRTEIVEELKTEAVITGSLLVGATVFVELSHLATRLDSDAEMILVPLPAVVAMEFALVGALVGYGFIRNTQLLIRHRKVWGKH